MSTTYTTVAKVAAYLGMPTDWSGVTKPTKTDLENIINQNEDRIDRTTGHAWRNRYSGTDTYSDVTSKYEYYDAPDVFDVIDGGKIALRHSNIYQLSIPSEQVDACEATTGWTASGTNSISTSTAQVKQGTYSLTLVKSDVTSATCSASKTTTTVDVTAKTFSAAIYISATLYAKLKTAGTVLEIRFGSDSSNYYAKTYTKIQLASGWNTLTFTTAMATSSTGTPVVTACDYTYIAFVTSATSDTAAAGDFIFDDLKLLSYGDALEVWENNAYVDYLATKTEGRANDYWLNYEKGVLYIFDLPSRKENAVRIKYRYGGTTVPLDIERACTLMTAIDLVTSDDRSVLLPSGDNSALRMSEKIEVMQREVEKILTHRTEYRFMKRN